MGWAGTQRPKLKIPYCPGDDEAEPYEVNTIEEKMVADYTGFDFDRIEELTVFEFWLYLRDAAVFKWQQTDAGREYLAKCKRMEQTEPDRKKLRKKLGKK